jgi:hypothetical protein
MPMKRRLSKANAFAVSDVAVRLYEEMRLCGCTCAPPDDHFHTCPGCDTWWDLQHALWGELGLKLWEWPVVGRNMRPGHFTQAHEVWAALEQARLRAA